MGYLDDWKRAKQAFEKNTKSKKPSEKFLGVFRKSSGLEKACKALDSALAKPSLSSLEKAMLGFAKARDDYIKILHKTDKADRGDSYTDEIEKLEDTLTAILEDFSVKKQDALNRAPRKLKDILGPYYNQLSSDALLRQDLVRWFPTSKDLAKSGVDGTPLPGAVQCQKRFAQSMKAYATALKKIRSAKDKAYVNADGIDAAADMCGELSDALMPINEGMMYHVRMWVDAQETAFKNEGRAADLAGYVSQGPLGGKITALGQALNDEMVRLNNLEGDIRALKR